MMTNVEDYRADEKLSTLTCGCLLINGFSWIDKIFLTARTTALILRAPIPMIGPRMTGWSRQAGFSVRMASHALSDVELTAVG